MIISFMIVETGPLTFFDTIGRIWGFYDTAFFFRLLPTLGANQVQVCVIDASIDGCIMKEIYDGVVTVTFLKFRHKRDNSAQYK